MKFKWEEIFCESLSITKRAKIIGGWLIIHRELWDDNPGESLAMTFVPDPDHKWKITF